MEEVIDANFWQILDRAVQYLIIPGIMGIIYVVTRQNKQEKEILRLAIIMEERNVRRDSERQDFLAALARIDASITNLSGKFELSTDNLDRKIQKLEERMTDQWVRTYRKEPHNE